MVRRKHSTARDRQARIMCMKRGADGLPLTARLLKAKSDWQNTFDSIPEMICLLDVNARITRVNKAFSAGLGRPYNELLGRFCHEVVHGAAPPPGCRFRQVIETGRPAEGEIEIKIGDSIYAASLSPLFDSSGRIRGAVHIFRNITEQKLLIGRLAQAEKMAAIGQLVAEIAHEINNPLDYITNYLYLLSEALPPDFQHRNYLKRIETGIDNLAALTRDMLEFSRPQIDAYRLLDLHRVIDDAFEFSSRYIAERRVEVVRSFGMPAARVMGSERMLQQVFLNLILNAIDAMPDGGTITVSTSCSKGRLVVEFSDTGIGIPKENIPRIFEPFFTTKKTIEKRGTGLGLTICYNIMHQHQGDIHVSSAVGKGTTVTLSFPLAQEDAGSHNAF